MWLGKRSGSEVIEKEGGEDHQHKMHVVFQEQNKASKREQKLSQPVFIKAGSR